MDATQLCALYAGRVYKFAAMVSHSVDDAEDLAQDALVRAIRGVSGFDPRRGSVEAWLWQIVVNTARDAGRLSQRRRALLERVAALTPRANSYGSESPDGLSDLDLLDAVRRLPRRPRSLVALRFGADLDYATIGRLLGISEVAARVATKRALALLHGYLE
ncbi:MAG: sigma-70 family RNA polymerase sigma factor [Candidatus Dormibacteraeota bacterium]|nr:sigma-70 family RNA polymerase sigma factor [Candidatus Dormibacteraeota bacterium]